MTIRWDGEEFMIIFLNTFSERVEYFTRLHLNARIYQIGVFRIIIDLGQLYNFAQDNNS